MQNLTILVNSCDKYEDAWEPFFRLLSIQWKDCPYEIVLNTETKTYTCDYLNVRTVCSGKNVPWAKRLRFALERIDTDYILYFLEDFFLMEPVDVGSFNKALELLQNDSSVGYIGLKNNKMYTARNPDVALPLVPFFDKDILNTMHRVNNQAALWQKDWMIQLIRDHETPWEFDNYATIRSKRYKKQVLLINNNVLPPVFTYEVDYEYGYGISGAKWLPKNKELFKKFGIEVDFSRLGWLDVSDGRKSVMRREEPKSLYWKVKKRLSILKKRLRIMKSVI